MSEFHDPDLRQQLGRLSGPYPDDNVAFAAVQHRVGQARRRRAVAWTTAAAMSLVIFTVGVAAVQSPRNHSIVPGKSSETSAEVTFSVATTEDEELSTTEPTAAKTTDPVVLASDTTASTEVVETSMPDTESTESAGSSSGASGSRSTPAPSLTTQTFSSVGGSITVRQDGDRLTLVGVTATPGFEAEENRKSGGRVEVTFRSKDHRSNISVKVSDGIMNPNISEEPDNDNDNDTTTSDQSSDGDNGDGSDND
jgi:hypothetical protein